MPDHLFGSDFDEAPAPPISGDNSDHLFGGDYASDASAAAPSKTFLERLGETSIGKFAKAAGQAMVLPGQVAQGQFSPQPQVPGELSELDLAQQDWAKNAMIKRAGGAALTTAGSIGGIPALTTRAGESILPFLNRGISPETAQLAKTAIDKYGYPVRPGQMSDNHFVRSLDSLLQKIPGSGYKASSDAQQTAINRGVAGLIGQDADKLTPEVMSAAKTDLGKAYKQIYGPDVKAPLDEKFSAGIMDTLDRASQVLDDPNKVKVLNKSVSNILDKVKDDGTISGPAYQGLRQTGSVLKDLEGSGGKLGDYASEIKGHLDDLFRRTIPSDKADLLRQTDKQYAIMKQLRPLAADATATGGDVSAARLMQLAKSGDAGRERMAFGNGGDLGELAGIGQRFKTMPSSNTAENHQLLTLLQGGGLGLTSAGAYFHEPLLAAGPLAAAGTGWATSRLLGNYMKNPDRAQKLIQDALSRKPNGVIQKGRDVGVLPYSPALQGLTAQQ